MRDTASRPAPHRRRVLVGAGLCLAVAAVISAPSLARSPQPAPPPRSAPAAATTSPATPAVRNRPVRGEVTVPGGVLVGEWEEGVLLGEPLVSGRVGGREQLVYAARGAVPDTGDTRAAESTYVATGVRDGERILRMLSALDPGTVTASDGIDLYGGDVLGGRGPDEQPITGATYLLLGLAPGDVDVSVAGPDGTSRAVTAASTAMLPGFTVFYDTGAWRDDWDPVRLAPLTVVTSDGRSAGVRARSWTG